MATVKKSGTIQFTSVLERSDNKLWGSHFEVPKSVAKKLVDKESSRVVCTLNTAKPYQCAILPHGNGTFIITVNKKLKDSLKLSYGDEVHVQLIKDRTEYGLPFPEEFKEVLNQDKVGDKLFHALTKGKQRTLLYIIGNVKDTDKRIHRSLMIVYHLKENKGIIDYKRLNVLMKNSTL